MAGPRPFKLDGKQFFCTWPRTGEHWDADEFFAWLNDTWGLDWCRIALEGHADGEPHVHAAFKLGKRLQTTDCHVFDYRGRHGKYECLKSPAGAAKYFEKEQYFDYGRVPKTMGRKRSAGELAAIADGDELEYLVQCADSQLPYQYAKRFRELKATNDHTILDFEADLSRERFDLMVRALPDRKTICIVGPTGVGKTSWAKRVAPKPALWVRHMDVLRAFVRGYHRSIIFDDMSFLHLPRETQIHVTDEHEESQIHCRYGVATIPAGTVKIFTANVYPFTDDPAINRRVHAIHLE